MVWFRVAGLGDIPPGQGKTVTAGQLRLALFNDDGRYYATDDACPHQGASLAAGSLHRTAVICPLHQWVFDLRTGHCPNETHEPVAVYATRCSESGIEVEIPAE